MHPLNVKLFIAFSALSAGGLALKFWRGHRKLDPEVNVKAGLQVNRTLGWTFFNLALLNRSRMRIAVVDATFTISGLVGKFQACAPAKDTTFKIRRVVMPGGLLGVGLMEHFYLAAGKPQGSYSFVVATTVRFRAHGDLFEQALPLYRVKMFALSANDLRRLRWYNKPAVSPEAAPRLPDLDPADLQWLDSVAGRASA